MKKRIKQKMLKLPDLIEHYYAADDKVMQAKFRQMELLKQYHEAAVPEVTRQTAELRCRLRKEIAQSMKELQRYVQDKMDSGN
jgi:hypothetical protein